MSGSGSAPPVLLMHDSSVEHLMPGGHPEQVARMRVIADALSAAGWCGYERVPSPAAAGEDLLRVHAEALVDRVERLALTGGGQIDGDTSVSPGSYRAARHAAGGALELARRLLDGRAPCGFSVHRPPGHHAEPDRAMGFCLLNSIAVAAAWAVAVGGCERVMIVDYDVHHGNGTNAAFAGDPRVLFVSIHQSPLYPGTGPLRDVGAGDGLGYSVNLPVAPGSGDTVFGGLVDGVAVELARAFDPALILISAGFDAASADPLADCAVTDAGFAAMTASLRDVAFELGAPCGAVLEGGYSLDALGGSVVAAMSSLAGAPGAAPRLPASELVPEAAAARAFLARWWPALAV